MVVQFLFQLIGYQKKKTHFTDIDYAALWLVILKISTLV